jgi:hypothetical protein
MLLVYWCCFIVSLNCQEYDFSQILINSRAKNNTSVYPYPHLGSPRNWEHFTASQGEATGVTREHGGTPLINT